MAGTAHRLARASLAACLLLALAAPAARADGESPRVRVPDVRNLRLDEARRRLEAGGLALGKVYEVSRERILAAFKVRYPAGFVFMQAPSFADAQGLQAYAPAATPVHVVLCAERDGPELPPNLPGVAAPPQAKALEAAPGGPAAPPASPGQDTRPSPRVAEGSPDAPRPAPPPDPAKVPALAGLELAEAEQLVRESGMTLYVERVPGHPVGRVLEQVPVAGSKRPVGGVVKVVVTAGGDFEGERPGAPEVYLAEIQVPGVLDRTRLQARRILEALGLTVKEEQGKRGPPGRVVDQMPAAGGHVPKGGVVRVWIAPGGPQDEPPEAPLPPGPLQPGGGDGPAAPEGETPAPPAPPAGEAPPPERQEPPPAPGALPAGIPAPVSPGANTQLPKGETVPVGFTWRGVQGAEAYLLEIEEQGAEGRWIPLARRPSRKTAVLLDVERLDPRGQKPLRWRVSAVVGGRPGQPSAWVPLR